MNNERAIQLLHRLQDEQFDGVHGDERREALDMAVRALEPNLGNNGFICTKTRANDEDRTTDDLISRKQVLNASHFVACWDGVEHFSLEVVDADFIQKLPSVHPTQTNAQSMQINTLDCVSREAVLDAIDKYILGKLEGCTVEVKELLKLITKIYHMPIYRILYQHSERNTGKWIELKCNQCGQVDMSKPNFCPNCGADMRGGDAE